MLQIRKLVSYKYCVMTSFRTYAANPISEKQIDDLRQFFLGFPGGSVDLKKDEKSKIAYIFLNNPERRNALSGKMMADLHDSVCELERWTSGKGVILHSSGPIFCSGGDLTTVKQISNPQDGDKMCEFMQHITQRLLNLPLVSVALISGRALGGGAELTTSCDFRAMTQNAEISFVQAKMGVATGWGGGTRLVKIVGRRNALKALLSCEKIDAKRAAEIGLVDYVIEENEDPLNGVSSWLERLLSHDETVVRSIKNVVTVAEYLPPLESLQVERSEFAPLWGGKANKAALQQNIKHK
ncbi:ethylmalonyl-CoA decarboxylase-like [Artemia franciscana]|uniref:Ethylmalonyl-CoA decarboxylase n=1 Tax=Artemia franciscana TaxID=6661 RepID=A0AA88H4Z0_ARTSF|nr:hypothetical protein QYM36_017112 [Artemia franciscana]KAK2704950.1 hypothetical protein QYM36_017112 [Artemia franciscana]KAK2704951.1 hypothetical protein QYM36_017112 [Artemia franciscana]KAK2704952.1 hypothetical protein QYM36_017112 [Artemia franciscana]